MRPSTLTAALAGCLVLSGVARGQDASNLAQQVQNPLANLVSLPIQLNYNLDSGPEERTAFNMNLQPVIPFPGKEWNVITRTIIPINSVPQGDTDSIFGIGDTTMSLFFSPAKAGKLIWGVGPEIGLPTASNQEVLGSGKWGLGPTGVALYQSGPWTVGAVAGQLWSVAGNDARDDYSVFTCQYFINYNFGGGWTFGTAPIVVANWKAPSGQRWTIPWGAQISKVTHFGSRPVNLIAGYYYNATRPDQGADSQVRFQVNFLFPTSRK